MNGMLKTIYNEGPYLLSNAEAYHTCYCKRSHKTLGIKLYLLLTDQRAQTDAKSRKQVENIFTNSQIICSIRGIIGTNRSHIKTV